METSAFEVSICLNAFGQRAPRVLEALSMGWNKFGYSGACAIAEGLRHNRSLKKLYLPRAYLTDKGASQIICALNDNPTLTTLDTSGNSVSIETCVVLEQLLSENQTLQHLIMRANPLGVYGAKRLLQGIVKGEYGYGKFITLGTT